MTYTPPDPVARPSVDVWHGVDVGDTSDPAEIREIFDRAIGTDDSLNRESLIPSGFAEWFVVAQTFIPALLYVPGAQSFRLPIRIASYAIALVGFAVWWFNRGAHRSVPHPSERWLILAVAYLGLMLFHPLTNGLLAGVAQIMLYVAIFCAVFWAPAYVERPRQLVRILAMMLICNGVNSVVGVLQVYDPDRWMPRELSFVYSSTSRMALDIATYIGPGGRRIVRPPGLFDTPGAVCGAGTVAALLGLVFALERFTWWKRLGALGLSLAGISAIYLSHVRASLVVTLGMMAVYAATLIVQGERKRLTAFAGLAGALIVVGLMGSVLLGGPSIQERFSTLVQDDPGSIYYTSRGRQLAAGFNELLDEYPFGAGLARWGMMRGYFGDPSHLDSTALWAEVQPNAWMLDGGLFLLGLYSAALLAAAFFEWRLISKLFNRQDRMWAAVVTAVNIGTLALIFTFVPFATQVGLQYWFLEGALHGAMVHRLRK
jgi:hypothetical protein